MEIGCQEKRRPKDDSAPLFEFSEVENAREFASRALGQRAFLRVLKARLKPSHRGLQLIA
jgi:hypothetical protein